MDKSLNERTMLIRKNELKAVSGGIANKVQRNFSGVVMVVVQTVQQRRNALERFTCAGERVRLTCLCGPLIRCMAPLPNFVQFTV